MNQAYTEQSMAADWSMHIFSASNPVTEQLVPTPNPENRDAATTAYDRQMTQFAVEQEEQLKRLQKEYVFDDPLSVRTFLNSHRFLSEILLEAAPQLRGCFGEDSTLKLEVMSDEGLPRTIYGVIVWKGSVSSARNALRKFDENWCLSNSRRTSGKIVFDYQLA